MNYEELYRKLYEENQVLKLALANAKVMQRITAHDLKSPLANTFGYLGIIDEELAKLRAISKTEELKNIENKIRTSKSRIETATNLISDQIGIMSVEDFTPEQVRENPQEFNPIEEIRKIIEVHHHYLLSRDLGMSFEYSRELKDTNFNTNKSVFSSLFSNLLSNTMKYAQKSSVIKSLGYLSGNDFNFELENMITAPIDFSELERILEKGYTQKEIKQDKIYEKNEGIGLAHARRLVRKSYQGKFKIISKDRFQITYERTRGLEKETYGVEYPTGGSVPNLPSFHVRIAIPMKNLMVPKEKGILSLEDRVALSQSEEF